MSTYTFNLNSNISGRCDQISQGLPISMTFSQPNSDFDYDIPDCPLVELHSKDKNIIQKWEIVPKSAPTNVLFTSTTPDITINVLPKDIYIVRHIITDPICGNYVTEKEINLECFDCRCRPNQTRYVIDLGDTPVAKALFYNKITKTLKDQCVFVFGNLILNEDYTFDNVLFIMKPKSKITVADKKKVKFIYNDLHSCNLMWQGIELTPDVTFDFISNSISDAEKAIDLASNASVKIVGNNFRNNYKGINFDKISPLNYLLTSKINQNTFSCSGNKLLPPRAGEVSFAGISTTAAQLLVGNSLSGSTNTFVNLQNAVYATGNSLIEIKNAIVANTVVANEYRGFVSNASKLTATSCAFDRLLTAFDTEQSILSTSDVTINNADLGYNLQSPNQVTITGTTKITNTSKAFSLTGTQISSTAQPSKIIGVNILMGPNDYGSQVQYGLSGDNFIGATNPGLFVFRDAVIDDNATFNQTILGIGINLQSVKNLKIINNNATFNGDAGAGIVISGCDDIRFRENKINQQNNSNNYVGISLIESNRIRFCCNEINMLASGNVYCYGINTSHWRNTKITAGFICDQATSIDRQEDGKNRWLGVSPSARHYAGQNYISFSKFLIDHPDNQDEYWVKGNIDPLPQGNSKDWFENPSNGIQNIGSEECDDDVQCGSFVERKIEHPTKEDELIATRLILSAEFGATADWIMSKRLYNRMLQHPNFKDESESLNTFFERVRSTNIPLFNDIEQKIANINQLSAEENEGLSTQSNWREMYSKRIVSYYESMAADSTQIVTYQPLLKYYQNELSKVQLRYAYWIEEIKQTRRLRIDSLLTLNRDIKPSSQWEENQKTVNSIYLSTLFSNKAINEREAKLLAPIAYKCLYSAGPAVLLARSLYKTWDKNAQWQPNEYCGSPKKNQNPGGTIEDSHKIISSFKGDAKEGEFLIYPNPAQNLLNIQYQQAANSNFEILIFSATGNSVFNSKLASENTTIDINHLNNGIYYCAIIKDGKVFSNQKLVIIR